jgi:hypothetical protein
MAVQNLPQTEQDYLRLIRDDLPALRSRVQSLREQGWTLNAIGSPLEARRSTVRSWEHHPDTAPSDAAAPPIPPLPSPPNLRPAPPLSSSVPTTIRALRPDVPAPDQDRIRQLAPLARKVRGGTPPNSPFRDAKAQLDALLLQYHARGVSVQRLADLAGVSYRAMKVRLDTAHARAAHPSATPRAAGL